MKRPLRLAIAFAVWLVAAGIRRVSMADNLDNARAILTDYRQIGDTLWSRFNAGRDDQLWYLRTLSDVFASGGAAGNLVCEFGATVREIDRLCSARHK